VAPASIDEAARRGFIRDLAEAPIHARRAVSGLDEEQLDTPYRPGGWSIRQTIHHLPDSHTNAYLRFKLALTEDNPQIRTYEEALWAELPDAKSGPLEPSLALLDAIHVKWVRAIEAVSRDQLARTFRHPELGPMSLDVQIALYAWHGRHHVAHVMKARERQGWV
jgi:hypothetical protein